MKQGGSIGSGMVAQPPPEPRLRRTAINIMGCFHGEDDESWGNTMKSIKTLLEDFGLNPNEEISQLLKDADYPKDYNPIVDFDKERIERSEFINNLIQKGFMQNDILNYNVLEIGGGICSTGAAFARKCNAVISFELEKVHCLYAKRCKEHFNIPNLAVYLGSIIDIEGNKHYSIKINSVDLVISYFGMFRFTILNSLSTIYETLKPNGQFICVYPRFWTNTTKINSTDKELLIRALAKNQHWNEFNIRLKEKLSNLNFLIEHEGLLENHEMTPIGGDVIIGSDIASTRGEYLNNPIEGIIFEKTLITCNTLICRKL